jgi:dipeptidyl aminopeptidase/acylaminoacyl peptidase
MMHPLFPGVVLIALLMTFGCGTNAPTGPSPSPAPSAATPTTPGRHVVSLPGDAVTLGGILHLPEASGARPAIIVLHGWQPPGTNGAAVVEARAARFARDGYVALALSLRGWPPSGGTDDCGLRQPNDVAAAASWLRGLPNVSPDRIAIIGFSQGGQVAILTATRDARLRGVVAYFPVTDVARWKVTTTDVDIPGYIATTCEPGGVAPRSPVAQAARVTAPVLLVHGDADTRVPLEQSFLLRDALGAAGRPVQLVLVPGAQHGFSAVEDALVQPDVDRFLADVLR